MWPQGGNDSRGREAGREFRFGNLSRPPPGCFKCTTRKWIKEKDLRETGNVQEMYEWESGGGWEGLKSEERMIHEL